MVSEYRVDKSSPITHPIAIDDSLQDNRTTIEETLEKILLWAHQKFGADQLVQAKEQFYWKTGKFFPDDEFYSRRIKYFIDSFIFERPLESSGQLAGKTPYESYKEYSQEIGIQTFRHSIFLVLKANDQGLILRDLFNPKEKLRVSMHHSESFDGIMKNDIFQCYIYQINDHNWLSRGLIFHPHKAYRAIKKSIKKHLKSEDFQAPLLLNQLARQQIRHQRHNHVDPKIFYNNDSI